MTLEQILTLKMIHTTGSFRSASLQMHKAQSAISYAIRSLESEVGFSLFTRDKYRPELTPQGRAFLKKATPLLEQVEALKLTADFLQRGYEPQIRLVVSALFPLPLLTECLKSFQEQYPRTEIQILHDVLSAEEQLLGGVADLAFGELLNETQALKTKDLVEVTLKPVAASALTQTLSKNKNSRIQQLSQRPQIILTSTGTDRSKNAAIISSNNISVQNFESKKQLLLAGLGWGFMPVHLIQDELKAKKLIQTHSEEIKIGLRMAHLKKMTAGPCVQHIWKFF